MSDSASTPTTPSASGDPSGDTSGGTSGGTSGSPGTDAPSSGGSTATTSSTDPLRSSRASGVWVALTVLVVVLVLLAIFILQNTNAVEITFLGWQGEAPLSAALLIATASGMLLAVAAGSIRILQLRRRVRRDQKSA